jgi:DNA processing protein
MMVAGWQVMLALLLARGVTRGACATLEMAPEVVWEFLATAHGRRELSTELGARVGPVDWKRYEAQIERLQRCGGGAVCRWDEDYPDALREVSPAPPLLFYRGSCKALGARGVAIVGTRKPSPGGSARSRELARELSDRHVTVTSGLARGIDTAAHQGALLGPSESVAVVGTGLDVPYPLENAELALEVAKRGCVVSEQLLGTQPHAGVFPMRNRIISGLSLAVVVVEGGVRSGALITAKWGLEQGRDIGAVPGFPGDFRSAGPNQLIKQGAFVVETVDDIAVAVPQLNLDAEGDRLNYGEGAPQGGAVYEALTAAPAAVDEIAAATGMPVSRVQEALARLEIDGRVWRDDGGRYARRSS